MRKVFEIGGIVAAAVLIAFGIAAIVMGVNGQIDRPATASSSEKIVGSPDMTPAAIKAEAKKAGLNGQHQLPDAARRRKGDQQRAHAARASPATCGSTRSRRPVA